VVKKISLSGLRKIKKITAGSIIAYTLLVAVALIVLLPIYIGFLGSFKHQWEIFATPYSIPKKVFLDNYIAVLKAGVARNMLNSLIVTAVSTIIVLFISSSGAYVFSRLNFFGKNILFWVVISGLMIPVYGVVIPMFVFMDKLHLINTYFAVIAPYVGFSLPFSMLVLRGYLSSLPKELDDAAKIDGCSYWKIYWHIILPLSRPGLAAVLIFVATGIWSELPFALVLLRDKSWMTLPPAMLFFANNWAFQWPFVLAVVCLAIAPIMILYFLLAEQFIKGLTAGALKM